MTESAQPQLFAAESVSAQTTAKKSGRKKATPKKASEPTPENPITPSLNSAPAASETAPLKKSKPTRAKKKDVLPQNTEEMAPAPETEPMPAKSAPRKPRTKPSAAAPKKGTRKTVVNPTAENQVLSTPAPSPAIQPPNLSQQQPDLEEWSPSAGRSHRAVGTGSEATPANNPSTASPTHSGAPHPTSASSRQYPVYVPLHVAKQMEQEGKPAPLAVTATQAVELHLPVSEVSPTRPTESEARPTIEHAAPQPERQERSDRSGHERSDRNDRGDRRHGRHGRGGRDDRRHRRDDSRTEFASEQTPYEPHQYAPLEPPKPEELGLGEGMIEISVKCLGLLRDPKLNFNQHPNDIFVPPEIVRSYGLRDGQWIKCETRRNPRGFQVHALLEVNGETPEKAKHLPAFDELTVISPIERIQMETVPDR